MSTKIFMIMSMCTVLLFLQYRLYTDWILPKNRSIPLRQGCIQHCSIKRKADNFSEPREPTLYIITPTYKRPEQLAELMRLSHTLMLIPDVVWLVIEDAYETNDFVEELLLKTGIKFCYMFAPTPYRYRGAKYTRGVTNRNKGINWIRKNAKNGVVYFADDDNSYDLELFSEIRKTQQISMFPVGLLTQAGVSTPIVVNCTFIGFYDEGATENKHHINVAGFAVSVKYLLEHPDVKFPFEGDDKSDVIIKMLSLQKIELLASCCTRILVWHVRTITNKPALKVPWKYRNTNLAVLKKFLI